MSEDSKNTLFVEIFQPFAQYRNPFTFYYAQTYPLPPKSTILGMLQNAVEDWYG
ncbi:MAG: CRISPR-associated protein Cas5, partial [Fervidicoccus fontis]